ncbi:Fur family transcriptional regulator [Salidesulfovibrio brasiliensis]|uniref:Fur family transcriptional regulator n=1 Tax=Salidesulfovibrio brasiliensis TaxID=221711 RepID=UPI0006D23504|nr:Fur family transcriptional regulator [Salidesulfovibrio brasiliensis]
MKDPRDIFKTYLTSNGLKLTSQRKLILNVFMTLDRPVTSEELFQEGHSMDESISLSTVYRSLKHLQNAGIARCVRLTDGVTRYECVRGHDSHLICERCGKRIPLDNPYLDCVQREAARQEGFRVYHCCVELHGICHDCAKGCDCARCHASQENWRDFSPSS